MTWQTVMDKNQAETVLRVVQNAYTATLTITAGSIAKGSPVIFATNTGSLPSTDTSAGQNFVQRPATSTAIVNNLVAGLIAAVPGTKAYLDREEAGLAIAYGPYVEAVVHVATDSIAAGRLMIPDSPQELIDVSGPVTAAATASAGHVEVPALGGHFILMSAIASSSATDQGTAPVFVRCM